MSQGLANIDVATEAKQDAQITQLATIITNTTGLSLEVTQLLVKGVLDTIKTDTAKLDVLLSTRNAEVTQLLIKGVLDLIKAKTDNLDVLLSTRNSEATQLLIAGYVDGIEGLLTTLNAKDFATQTTLATRLSESGFDTKTGSLTETAPASDTASSGLNGRLQRIAQRITSLITALGSPFQAGGSIGNTTFGITNWLGSTAPTVGQKTSANSVPVVLPSDQTVSVSSTNDIATTQSTTTVAASTSSVLLKAANSSRKQITITNTSTKTLWICFFTPATSSTPFALGKDETWVFDKWTGVIYGIWDTAATGNAYITEETT